MACFPIFTDLTHQNVLICGGNARALDKARRLADFSPQLIIIADIMIPGFSQLPNVTLLRRDFTASDLDCAPALVIAAGNDREENHYISMLCRQKNIPVNVVDDPQLCTFYFPAYITQGSFSAGICTEGKSPTAAKLLKDRFQGCIPRNIDEILDWAQLLRSSLQERYSDPELSKTALNLLISQAFKAGRPLTDPETNAFLEHLD